MQRYALNDNLARFPGKIHSLCVNSRTLALNFLYCSFTQVRREANYVAHCFAKFVSSYPSFWYYNLASLPPSV